MARISVPSHAVLLCISPVEWKRCVTIAAFRAPIQELHQITGMERAKLHCGGFHVTKDHRLAVNFFPWHPQNGDISRGNRWWSTSRPPNPSRCKDILHLDSFQMLSQGRDLIYVAATFGIQIPSNRQSDVERARKHEVRGCSYMAAEGILPSRPPGAHGDTRCCGPESAWFWNSFAGVSPVDHGTIRSQYCEH